MQVIGQLTGRVIAVARFLSQAFEADRFEVPGNIRLQVGHGDRFAVQNLQDGVQRCLSLKRRPAGQQLVENRSQRVNIGGWTDAGTRGRRLFGAM